MSDEEPIEPAAMDIPPASYPALRSELAAVQQRLAATETTPPAAAE